MRHVPTSKRASRVRTVSAAGPIRATPKSRIPIVTASVIRCPVGKKEAAMFGVLGWIIFGLVVGVIAKLMMPGRDPGGFIITILLGIAGAVVGGFVGRMLGLYQPGEPAGFIMATIGAVLLLFLYRKLAVRT
jgi:uncharacterized membrane protein YeaQ/YmgE (transglycosylase-associated protein family)